MTLSESIKMGMKKAGINNYAELSKLSGVPIDTIKTYASQKGKQHSPNVGFLRKISAVIDLDDCLELAVLPSGKKTPAVSLSSVPKLSLSEKNNVPKSSVTDNFYTIPKLNIKASAGKGNEIMELESYESGEVMCIDKGFFKTPPSSKVRIIQVDGYSMIPMLLPDSWVIFEEDNMWRGDGLYVLNYDNELMVKLLQKLPNGDLEIISANKDYKSYRIEKDTQSIVRIIGKVLRSII